MEAVLLLALQKCGTEAPADVGKQTPFLPNLQASRGQTALTANCEDGDQYLRTWPKGKVPWQYVTMPRGQALPRSLFGARVAAAVRLVEEKRNEVLPAPRAPDAAWVSLTDKQFKKAWAALTEAFMSIWRQNRPESAERQENENQRGYRERSRGAFRTWQKTMYSHANVIENLLRYGFAAGDSP